MANAPRLRGGIIGCGFFAQFQLDAWRRMPDVEIAAACDLDLSRARAAAPCAYDSADEMLERERLDFLDVATRPETHLTLVRLAVERGIPVICQKPMAPNWADAVAIAEAAETSQVRIMIHENWRWQPWYREAKRLLDGGTLGRPIAYRFRTCKRDGTGDHPFQDQPYFRQMPRLLIYETMVHHLDTARFLFGEVERIFARIRRNNPVLMGEDQAHIVVMHTDGLLGAIEGHRQLDTIPRNGPALGEAWFEFESGVLRVGASGDLFLQEDLIWRNETKEGYRGDSVLATQRHFIDRLRSGEPFESEARSYLSTVALVEAAYESARRACEVSPRA